MKETELINLRGKREKHFLQENGDIIAKIYDDDVNFYNNGIYEEIDNNLIKEDGYYYNKNNSYKVMFKENSSANFMKYIFQEHYLNFEICNGNEIPITISKNDNQFTQQVAYNNVLTNIDFIYDILPSQIKENIFINVPDALNEKVCFKITSDIELFLNEDNSINVGNILNLEKPFIIDSEGKKCNYVMNNLIKESDYYLLELMLDVDSILKENLKFPIVIDPTITNYGENNSVYDTYIYPGDSNDVRYNRDYLKVGVDSNGKINRTLIKFDLPKIGTGSQIIEAALELRGYPDYAQSYASDIVTIHRVTEPWTESGANWSSMNDKYDSRVEAAFESDRSYYYDGNIIKFAANGDDLTNLVKKWYSMYPNYGLMLKTADETYHESVIPMFFSKNNTVTGGNPKPLLMIRYRNQNGLEEYMDYKTIPFVNGSAYVNSYNGNLTTMFEVGKTIKGKYPVKLDLIYNTNDVVLENDYGFGKGYKLNLQQTIKPVVIDNTTYLEYVDEDGTIHYFFDDNGTYVDEDGLNLNISVLPTLYVLWNKNGIVKRFQKYDNIGYLVAIEDSDGNIVSIEYNNNFTISKITDPNNKEINISYENNIITINSLDDTVYLNYVNNKISSIVRRSGTTYYNYDSNNLISSIIDEDNLKIGFEYYNQEPYRIKKVCEYATDDTMGNYFILTYNYNSTTIKNNNDNIITMTFNDNGCVESSSNLSSGEDVFNAYGRIEQYFNPVELENDLSNLKHKNKLMSIDLPCKYVKNYISDSSFENNNNTIFSPTSGVNLSIVTEQSNTGQKSLKAINSAQNQILTKTISVEKGNYYTFSASIKNSANVKISLSYNDSSNNIVEEFEEISYSSDFERYDVSILYPLDATSNLVLKIYLVETGVTYIDDVQLEEGCVANPYNLLDNSDFSTGLTGWNLDVIDLMGNDVPTNNVFEVVTLSTGKKALKVKMSPLYQSSFSKIFPIYGKAGDTYKISFWYKNRGLKGSDLEFSRTNNKVIINFNYTDSQYGHGVAPSEQFNPNENEWQYFSTSFTAEHDFNSMYLDFFQTFNANDFYITNLYVMKDYRTVNYNYDDNGNIISVSSLNNEEIQFKYNDDNELIKMISPNGNALTYEYNKDLPDKINTAINKEKILTKIKYDNFQNPITTKIIPSKNIFSPNELKKAKIRIKGTNKYIKLFRQEVIVTENDCNHNYWYLSFISNDTCKIYNPVLTNCFLGIDNNNNISSQVETNLTLILNDDGSYYIKKSGTNDYLVYDEQYNHLWVNSLNESDDNYKFYIEQTDKEKFIENNATYSEDGRFITSITDSMANRVIYDYNTTTGLLLSATNPKGITTNYTYNNKHQIISKTEDDREVNYSYNANNLLSKIELDNKEYNIEYDNFLNPKKVKINNDVLINNFYGENNGNLIKTTYGNNDEILYSYDGFDRIKKITKSDDVFNYEYGNNGNLNKIISNNHTHKFYYDLANRIKKIKFDDFRIKYDYDIDDNIVNKKYTLDNHAFNVSNVYVDNLLSSTTYDDNTLQYEYDNLNRLIQTPIDSYTYKSKGKRTSKLIESITNVMGTFKYKYDKMNNITHVYLDNNLINRYYYDNHNQLIKEDSYITNQTIVYIYDLSGNIINKKIYTINTDNLVEQKIYNYTNSWEDQLTSFDNKNIIYDEIGNPTNIGNNVLLWTNGRELKSYNNIDFKYNQDNIRISKTVNNIETKYFLEDSKIVLEKQGNNVIYYMYNGDELIGFKYNGNTYFYVKNLQKDIIAIVDEDETIIAKYSYDSWGNILSIVDSDDNPINNSSHIGLINPFRYRSYYYDTETNLYYLNNRYYSPEFGRFINTDYIIDLDQELLSYNLYLYCNNNPISFSDPNGDSFISDLIKNVTNALQKAINNTKKVCPAPTSVYKSENKNKLPTKSKPNSELEKPNGDKRIYGPDGRATTDLDYSHPNHHPELGNPHAHDWDWTGDIPKRGPAYNPNNKKNNNSNYNGYANDAKNVTIAIGGGYIAYRIIRFLPSLLPTGWWSIPANVAMP